MFTPRGYVFIGLNVVRILSIIALLLVFASSIVVMVNDIEAVNRFVEQGRLGDNSTLTDIMVNCDYIMGSTVPNQPAGPFWAVVNRLLIIGQVVVLILSELGWPASFFNRFFPVLGNEFGLGALGVMQCLIGAAVLSHHVDDFALVSAFFLFSIGCLNIFIGFWREPVKAKRSTTSWRENEKGVLPTYVAGADIRHVRNGSAPFFSPTYGGSEKPYDGSRESQSSISKSGLGYGRQGEKAAEMNGYMLTKPLASLPRYSPARGPGPVVPEPDHTSTSSTTDA